MKSCHFHIIICVVKQKQVDSSFRLPSGEVCKWGGGGHTSCPVDIQGVRGSLYQQETGPTQTGLGNIHTQISGKANTTYIVFHLYTAYNDVALLICNLNVHIYICDP